MDPEVNMPAPAGRTLVLEIAADKPGEERLVVVFRVHILAPQQHVLGEEDQWDITFWVHCLLIVLNSRALGDCIVVFDAPAELPALP